MRPASPLEEVNLGSRIAMEVDDEYDWLMEEASFKLVDGLLRDSSAKDWVPQSTYRASIALKLSKRTTWHNHQVIHYQTPPFVKRGRVY